MTQLLSTSDAKDFLNSFGLEPTSISTSEEKYLQENNEIIEYANDLLINRLKEQDPSLRITDVISAKDTAFKHNRQLLGKEEKGPQLIPATINIQVINN